MGGKGSAEGCSVQEVGGEAGALGLQRIRNPALRRVGRCLDKPQGGKQSETSGQALAAPRR